MNDDDGMRILRGTIVIGVVECCRCGGVEIIPAAITNEVYKQAFDLGWSQVFTESDKKWLCPECNAKDLIDSMK